MKKATQIIIMIFLAYSSIFANKINTDKHICTKVLKSLQTGNSNLILHHIPTKEDIEYIISYYQIKDNNIKNELESTLSLEYQNKFKKRFFHIRDLIIKSGIDLNKVNIIKTFHKDRRFISFSNNKKIERTDIHMILKYNNLLYKIILDDCLKTKRGWVIFDRLKGGSVNKDEVMQQ